MRQINEIIIHCSATKEGKEFSASDIDRWHRERGFNCIGYHYVVKLDGVIERGRYEEAIGAHCVGHNAHSIGICYIGGLDRYTMEPKDTRTEAQKKALDSLLRSLKTKYPNAIIRGHRDFAQKECPCFNARIEYYDI